MCEKQPVIRSVFDQRMQAKDDRFFLKALQELQAYKRQLTNLGPKDIAYEQCIGQNQEAFAAYSALLDSLSVSENILIGVLNAFDVLTQEI